MVEGLEVDKVVEISIALSYKAQLMPSSPRSDACLMSIDARCPQFLTSEGR